MRILIDENISYRLIRKLADIFPGLEHTDSVGLGQQPDTIVWNFALQGGYSAILTADMDFQNKVLELGPPPKVIRVERYDFTTEELASILRRDVLRITDFLNSQSPLLVIRR